MRRQKYSKIAEKLRPYLGQTTATVITSTDSGEGGPHVHNLADLGGELLPGQAPWIVDALNALKPHGITDNVYHSVFGAAKSVIGLIADNTLGLLDSTSNGATAPNTLLRSGATGELTTGALTVKAGGVVPQIGIDEGVGTVYPNTRLETDNYVSQLAGWRLTYDGQFDARYIFANEMKIIKFIADLQQALAGSQIVSKSVTTLAASFTAPRPGLYSNLVVDDLPSAENMQVFEDGDMVLVTEDSRESGGFSSTRCWGIVDTYEDLPDKKQQWRFTRVGTYSTDTPNPAESSKWGINSATSTLILPGPTPGGTPTHAQTGDLMLAVVLVESTTITTTAPADWALIETATVTGMRFSLYTKVRTASEPGNYAWNHSAAVDSMGWIGVYQGQDPVSPIMTIIHTHESVTQFPIIKYIEPLNELDIILGFVAARANRSPVMAPAGWDLEYTATAGGNTLAAFSTIAGAESGDVTAQLFGGTARCITITVNMTAKPAPLDLTSGFMAVGTEVEPGAMILDYGKSGDGWHEITAIDGLYGSNSPYSRVVNWVGHPATGATVRTQDGNLKGIFGEGNEFGFFAGDGKTANDHYVRISNLAAGFNNIPLKLHTLGVQKVNIDSGGVDVWFGVGPLDKRLTWDGTTLGVKGAVTIDAPSGFGATGYLSVSDGGTVIDDDGVNLLTHTSSDRTSYAQTRGINLRTLGGVVIGQLTGFSYSGVNGVDLYARSSGQAQAIIGAELDDVIFGGGSAGAPRVQALMDAINNLLRLYSAGKIQLFQSGNATPDFEISGGLIKPNSPFSAIGLGVAPSYGLWTSASWQKVIEMAQGMVLLWRKGGSGSARAIGASSDGVLYITSSTANDTSAAPNYDLIVNPNGTVQIRSTIQTAAGIPWNLGAYTAGAPTATGYLTATVNGSTYRIAAQAV